MLTVIFTDPQFLDHGYSRSAIKNQRMDPPERSQQGTTKNRVHVSSIPSPARPAIA
jgi:hypothetical protein